MTVQTITKYEANDGSIHAIRLTSKTLTLAGTAPAGDVDSPIPAKVSKSNGEFGIRPRAISISRVVGSGATAFRKYASFPCLTPARWLALSKGDAVTYDGAEWEVVNRVAEDL